MIVPVVRSDRFQALDNLLANKVLKETSLLLPMCIYGWKPVNLIIYVPF